MRAVSLLTFDLIAQRLLLRIKLYLFEDLKLITLSALPSLIIFIFFLNTTKIAFADNQLYSDSIGISPLFTIHPSFLQQTRVHTFMTFFISFHIDHE